MRSSAGFALVTVASLAFAASCGGADRSRTADGDVTPDSGSIRPATMPGAASPTSTPAGASDERSQRRVVLAGVDLTGIGYDMGRPTAPIVIVDFSDFGCPFCASHARQTLPALEREYIATGKVFYKYVPFVMGMFPNGDKAARAAECAADQGKFWPMHDRLFATQPAWKRSASPLPLFEADAKELGLDGARFAACYAGQKTDARTQQATERANELGIRATPTLVVDGRAVEGALPIDEFRTLLDALPARGAGQGAAPDRRQ